MRDVRGFAIVLCTFTCVRRITGGSGDVLYVSELEFIRVLVFCVLFLHKSDIETDTNHHVLFVHGFVVVWFRHFNWNDWIYMLRLRAVIYGAVKID